MEIPTITVPVPEARERYAEYLDAIRRSSEDDPTRLDMEQMAAGYRALAQGKRILDLNVVMQEAGLDDAHRPRLAIMRADKREAFCQWQWDALRFAASQRQLWSGRTSSSSVRVPRSLFPNAVAPGSSRTYRALVPSVPARLRPGSQEKLYSLSNYHILWEADWEAVPVDPVLLRHLGGALYVVLGEWDLTELERAVLAKYL